MQYRVTMRPYAKTINKEHNVHYRSVSSTLSFLQLGDKARMVGHLAVTGGENRSCSDLTHNHFYLLLALLDDFFNKINTKAHFFKNFAQVVLNFY